MQQQIQLYREMIVSLHDKMGIKVSEENENKFAFFDDFVTALRMMIMIKSYTTEEEK